MLFFNCGISRGDMMNDNEDPTYHPRNRRGRKKREYDSLSTSIKEDLLPGYRILQDIIGISKFFLDEPEPRQRGMLDYYHVITKPISFNEIRRKFFEAEYNAIPEFISDVRLLLLNCYRYFGPDDVHTKRALRIEEILEKRIASLPGYLREQCSLEAANLVNKDSEQQSEKLEESNDLEKTATEDPGENQKKKEQGDLVQCQENQTEDEGQTKEVKDNFEDTEKKDIENEEEKEDKEKEETSDEKSECHFKF
ncbi:hypothetical protein C0J52_26838 [Blattella germanica]|nr:hypothetical protein C0J52_26838 [Blattella germanica]